MKPQRECLVIALSMVMGVILLAWIFTRHNSLRILARRSEIPMKGISKIPELLRLLAGGRG